MHDVAGLILAAGASSRMGSPKPLLKTGGKTLLEDQVRRMSAAGIENTFVVIGCGAEEIKDRHKNLKVTWVENRDWEKGKFSSVLCGISSVIASEMKQSGVGSRLLRFTRNDIRGILLLPVDTVLVPPEVMKQIIDEGVKTGRNIIPTFDGRGGHPVFLTQILAKEIAANHKEDERLDHVLNGSNNVNRLEVSSQMILSNINTLEDWLGNKGSFVNKQIA